MNRFLAIVLASVLVSCATPEGSLRRMPPLDISGYGLDQTINIRAFRAQEDQWRRDGSLPPPGFFPAGNYVPIYKAAPHYPASAMHQRKTGWVLVAYTVTEEGGIEDIRIVDEYPKSTFSRSALKAAAQIKFSPYIEDGVAIRIPNAWNIFTYEISY